MSSSSVRMSNPRPRTAHLHRGCPLVKLAPGTWTAQRHDSYLFSRLRRAVSSLALGGGGAYEHLRSCCPAGHPVEPAGPDPLVAGRTEPRLGVCPLARHANGRVS